MAHSKARIYMHLVWATWQREPMITDEWENRIYGCIRGEIERTSKVIAIGGISDHVHVLVQLAPTTSVSDLLQQMKGVSSRMVNAHRNTVSAFKWQPGYGAFSLSHTHLATAEHYVRHQREHHAADDLWPLWEEMGDDD